MNYNVYNVGHSNISFENFLTILRHWNIDCIIDVRSTPYTSYTPHFNKKELHKRLLEHSINYLHFKEEFGARSDDETMYTNGQIDFKKMTQRPIFQEGVARLKKGVEKGYTIALMCACAHPLSCHCFFMICQYLVEQEHFYTKHIFPYNKEKYKGFLSDNDKEDIMIRENDKELKYFVRGFQEIKHFDFENLKQKSLKKNPLRENTLFEKAETEQERIQKLKKEYLETRNKEVGYKLEYKVT